MISMEYRISERTRRIVSEPFFVRICIVRGSSNDELSIASAITNVQRERSQAIRTSNRISRACVIFVKNVPFLARKPTSRLPRTSNGRKKREDRAFSTKDPKKEETDYDERENRKASSYRGFIDFEESMKRKRDKWTSEQSKKAWK